MLVRLISNSWPCDLPALAFQSAGIIGVSHYAWLYLLFFKIKIEIGFHLVAQASLKALGSSNPPASASQSVGITYMSYCIQLGLIILLKSRDLSWESLDLRRVLDVGNLNPGVVWRGSPANWMTWKRNTLGSYRMTWKRNTLGSYHLFVQNYQIPFDREW